MDNNPYAALAAMLPQDAAPTVAFRLARVRAVRDVDTQGFGTLERVDVGELTLEGDDLGDIVPTVQFGTRFKVGDILFLIPADADEQRWYGLAVIR